MLTAISLIPTEWILTYHTWFILCLEILLYFCIANYVSMELGDVNVKFMQPKAPAKKFFWPDREDFCFPLDSPESYDL